MLVNLLQRDRRINKARFDSSHHLPQTAIALRCISSASQAQISRKAFELPSDGLAHFLVIAETHHLFYEKY
jgi:hypothetical protein